MAREGDVQPVYLKPNIQVEPLVNQWYAWFQILPPANAAFNIIERHIKTMESFINSPDMHYMAVRNTEMRGGPFIDLPIESVDKVEDLLVETREKTAHLAKFTRAVAELHGLLKKSNGFSMEPLYSQVPDLLKGYVELCYDLENRPTFKFYEPLLYRSPFYCESFQSIALSEINADRERPFIFTTPRLKHKDNLFIPIPFRDEGLDELFKMKRTPNTVEFIAGKLNVPDDDKEQFRSFFTPEKPASYQKYEGDSFRIRYFGHACILIETKDISILLDPILSYTYESAVSRYTYDHLPDEIDYVLITHSHQDHILLETMLQLRHTIKNIVVAKNLGGVLVDPSLKLLLKNLGFRNIIELDELEEIEFPGGSITGIPFIGEHHDLLMGSKLCYRIEINGKRILAVADSCNISPDLYERVHEIVGDVDALFLGMECDGSPPSWAYGPLFIHPMNRDQDRSRRGRGCNYDEAIDLVNRFNCKEIYVYAMGQEPWIRYILDLEYTEKSNPIIQSNKLIQVCKERGLLCTRLFGEREILIETT